MSNHYLLATITNNGNEQGTFNFLGAFSSLEDAKSSAHSQATSLLDESHPSLSIYQVSDANKVQSFTKEDFKETYQSLNSSLQTQIQNLQAQAQKVSQAAGQQ